MLRHLTATSAAPCSANFLFFSQLVEAYTTVREILQRFLADDDEWTESLAASAKGSLIYSWTEKEETVEDLVGQTVKAYMRQTDTKYNRYDKL